MPIYEYRCSACRHQFETIQRMNARPLRKCPECAGRLEKLISRTSFQLKGGGWYAQGYSKSAGKGEKKAKNPEARSSSDKSSGKTEAKAASA